MSRRTIIGFKLAISSIVFLCLTVVAALELRHLLKVDERRGPASIESGSIFEHRGNLSATELGLLGSTPLTRGRRVVFHDVQFRNQALSASNQVVLNLFPDLILTAQFQKPSAYTVNDGLYVGQINGDPESTVRILVQNGIIDGTIEYKGSEFRMIDGVSGQAIITQGRTPNTH